LQQKLNQYWINMKKAIIAVIAVVAVLSLSSCSKSCRCISKFNGEVLVDRVVELDEGERCSDRNIAAGAYGYKAELKCTPQLF